MEAGEQPADTGRRGVRGVASHDGRDWAGGKGHV